MWISSRAAGAEVDGLAGGKGVWVCSSIEATRARPSVQASATAPPPVPHSEQRLEGDELSVIGFTDGKRIACSARARTTSPSWTATRAQMVGMGPLARCRRWTRRGSSRIDGARSRPTLSGLRRGLDYRGFIYFGVMAHRRGARALSSKRSLGDPEAEALLPLIKSDLAGHGPGLPRSPARGDGARASSRATPWGSCWRRRVSRRVS